MDRQSSLRVNRPCSITLSSFLVWTIYKRAGRDTCQAPKGDAATRERTVPRWVCIYFDRRELDGSAVWESSRDITHPRWWRDQHFRGKNIGFEAGLDKCVFALKCLHLLALRAWERQRNHTSSLWNNNARFIPHVKTEQPIYKKHIEKWHICHREVFINMCSFCSFLSWVLQDFSVHKKPPEDF